jgi:hypothetical protein
MDAERERRLALRVKRLNELGRVASVVAGVMVAALYFKTQRDHGIAFTLLWIASFINGHGVTKLGFTLLENKADRALRAYRDSGGGTLPSAKIVPRPPRTVAARATVRGCSGDRARRARRHDAHEFTNRRGHRVTRCHGKPRSPGRQRGGHRYDGGGSRQRAPLCESERRRRLGDRSTAPRSTPTMMRRIGSQVAAGRFFIAATGEFSTIGGACPAGRYWIWFLRAIISIRSILVRIPITLR